MCWQLTVYLLLQKGCRPSLLSVLMIKRGHISGVVFGEQESCIFFLSLPISNCVAVSIHWSLSCLMLLHCSASPHALSPLSLSPLTAVRLVFLAYWYALSVTLFPSLSPSLLLSYSLTDVHIDTNTITCTFLSSIFSQVQSAALWRNNSFPTKKTTSKRGMHILKDW